MRNFLSLIIMALFAGLCLGQNEVDRQFVSDSSDVFVNGQGSHKCYRIPAMVTSKAGTLLAFCEGRRTMHDHANNDMVMRRSTDDGKNWSEYKVLAKSENIYINPSPVALANGDILLSWQEYPEDRHSVAMGKTAKLLEKGFGKGSQKHWIMVSKDDGKNWGKPIEITKASRGDKGEYLTAGSPARGIQLKNDKHKGRILLPLYCTTWPEAKKRVNFNAVLISDDKGKTWKRSEFVPAADKDADGNKPPSCNENHIAELANGQIIMNARGDYNGRYISYSKDGGQTWSKFEFNMQTTRNNNAMIGWPENSDTNSNGESYLVYVGNTDKKSRKAGKLFVSDNDGKSWDVFTVTVTEANESFGYSAMSVLKNGCTGLLYESFEADKKCIKFMRLNPGGKYTGIYQ